MIFVSKFAVIMSHPVKRTAMLSISKVSGSKQLLKKCSPKLFVGLYSVVKVVMCSRGGSASEAEAAEGVTGWEAPWRVRSTSL